jgi:hypothetical protein
VLLGVFGRFDSTRCRWRIENGTEASGCTVDAYGRRARRAWINLQCNRNAPARAVLISALEPTTCDYDLTIQSAEVCN